MKTVTVKVSSLKQLERNPRRHPNNQIRELKRSLEMFGQIRPFVIDETGTVLAGNGMLLAIQELGWESAQAYRLENLSEDDKKRLIIADNKVASLGSDDYGVIEELIQELSTDLNIPGFDDEVLRSLVASQREIETISQNYGKLDQDVLERAQAKSASIETAISRAEEKATADQPAGDNYTVCDSCGQRVWH